MNFGFRESYSGDAIKIENAAGKTLYFPYFDWPELETNTNIPSSGSSSDGSYKTELKTVDPRQFQLTGAIKQATKEETEAARDELIQFLNHSPLKIYPKGQDRFIVAYLQNKLQNWAGKEILRLTLNFIALDPFFYSLDQVQKNIVLLNIDNDFERVIEIENKGNIESYPQIELEVTSGSSSTLEIRNLDTGSFITLDTELSAGDAVTIDCEDISVEINGENSLNSVNDVFLLHSFFLAPGVNNIRFYSETEIKFDSKITYRSRWL